MTAPRIVTPEEAQEWIRRDRRVHDIRLLYTVATEPDRTRAAVVKALQKWRDRQMPPDHVLRMNGRWVEVDLGELDADIDAIENGAPL